MSWMNDESQEHITPIVIPVRTRVPRIFNIWGTLVYAVGSVTALACLVAAPWWTPPWWVLLPIYGYVFASMGIITFGRIENNKDARAFIESIKQRSEENKRAMN